MTPYSWKWILQELMDDLMHSLCIVCQQLPLQYRILIVPISIIIHFNTLLGTLSQYKIMTLGGYFAAPWGFFCIFLAFSP